MSKVIALNRRDRVMDLCSAKACPLFRPPCSIVSPDVVELIEATTVAGWAGVSLPRWAG